MGYPRNNRRPGPPVWTPVTSAPVASQPNPSNFVDLGEEGLQSGDWISPYLSDYLGDNVEVYIPPGEYGYDGTGFQGRYSNTILRGDPAGVEIRRPGTGGFAGSIEDRIMPNIEADGPVLFENLNIRGPDGKLQSRWRADGVSGNAELVFRNVNRPDGSDKSRDCSDSIGWYSEHEAGLLRFESCYVGGFGNNSMYAEHVSGGRMEIIDCDFLDANTAVRIGPPETLVRGCRFLWNEQPQNFYYHDGNPPRCTGTNARAIRIETGANFTIEDCDAYWGPAVTSAGGFLELQDTSGGSSGVVRNCRMASDANDSQWFFTDVPGGVSNSWSTSGIHASGANSGWATIAGSDPPNAQLVVWTPGGREPQCDVDADCPDFHICQSGRCVLQPPDETAVLRINSTRGSDPDNRNTFRYRVLVEGYIDQRPGHEDNNNRVSVVSEDPFRMEATGETGNSQDDQWVFNGTILEALVVETMEGLTVTPGHGMEWIVNGNTMENPEGFTYPVADECSFDTDCPEGQICVGGVCVDDSGGGMGCEADSECPEGQICVDGVCVDDPDGPGNGGTPDPEEAGTGMLILLGVGGAAAYAIYKQRS